ncbi:MAG: hypothetical protein IKP81_01515 [Paludibacteraceae bacterium]|nr:hypothetical protein [Paludibacteraceae bacterium]
MEIPSSRRVVQVCFPCLRLAYPVVEVLPSRQQGVVRAGPGAPPLVMEISSSRREVRVFFWGMRSAYPVTEVPSFRRRVDGLLLKMFCLKCQNWDFVLIFVV